MAHCMLGGFSFRTIHVLIFPFGGFGTSIGIGGKSYVNHFISEDMAYKL